MRLNETQRLIKLGVDAFKWYTQNDGRSQYVDGPLDVYDEAATILTDRVKFSQFLATFLGKNCGDILEVAAGTGLISQNVIGCGKLTCIDISKESLLKLRRRTRPALTSVANFYRLPFVSNHFDVIINVGGYRYVDDPSQYWGEMQRLLKINGRLIIGQFYPRVVGIRGKDIEKHLVPTGFCLNKTKEFEAKIELDGTIIKSGEYKLFEFSKQN